MNYTEDDFTQTHDEHVRPVHPGWCAASSFMFSLNRPPDYFYHWDGKNWHFNSGKIAYCQDIFWYGLRSKPKSIGGGLFR